MFGGGGNVWDEPDVVLSYIVTMLVNTMGIEVGVTLMTRGLVISGSLVSEAVYLENVTQMLIKQVDITDEDVPEEAREALKSVMDMRGLYEFDPDDFIPGPDAVPDDYEYDEMDEFVDDEMAPVIQYLHLKDPLILAGEPPINFAEGSDAMLRLRLTSIDGWMLGIIQPDFGDFMPFRDNGEVKH